MQLARRLFLVRLDAAQYRAASFLDDRILDGAEKIGWVPFAAVEQVAPHVQKRPLHFIFHAGHVGSTLLSRLLDEVPGVLGLREPLPLRSLAEMNDTAGGPLSPARVLNLLQLMWSRGFADTQTVIVKATSTAGRIVPEVVEAATGARAVYLNLRAEPYIVTLLSGANTVSDLEGHTHRASGAAEAYPGRGCGCGRHAEHRRGRSGGLAGRAPVAVARCARCWERACWNWILRRSWMTSKGTWRACCGIFPWTLHWRRNWPKARC